VCVNIDVTKPLPGSITVALAEGCVRFPIIYEGLHEVSPLCGVILTNSKLVPSSLCLRKLKS